MYKHSTCMDGSEMYPLSPLLLFFSTPARRREERSRCLSVCLPPLGFSSPLPFSQSICGLEEKNYCRPSVKLLFLFLAGFSAKKGEREKGKKSRTRHHPMPDSRLHFGEHCLEYFGACVEPSILPNNQEEEVVIERKEIKTTFSFQEKGEERYSFSSRCV